MVGATWATVPGRVPMYGIPVIEVSLYMMIPCLGYLLTMMVFSRVPK